MNRCDYCEFRNSWGCDDEWDRVSNDKFCSNKPINNMVLPKVRR